MAHAEICPVCHGLGQVPDLDNIGFIPEKTKPCHGCDGRGWLQIEDPPVIPFRTRFPHWPPWGKLHAQ